MVLLLPQEQETLLAMATLQLCLVLQKQLPSILWKKICCSMLLASLQKEEPMRLLVLVRSKSTQKQQISGSPRTGMSKVSFLSVVLQSSVSQETRLYVSSSVHSLVLPKLSRSTHWRKMHSSPSLVVQLLLLQYRKSRESNWHYLQNQLQFILSLFLLQAKVLQPSVVLASKDLQETTSVRSTLVHSLVQQNPLLSILWRDSFYSLQLVLQPYVLLVLTSELVLSLHSTVQQNPEQLHHQQRVYTRSTAKQILSSPSPMLAKATYSVSSQAKRKLHTTILENKFSSPFLEKQPKELPMQKLSLVLSSRSLEQQKELLMYQVCLQMSTLLVVQKLQDPEYLLDLEIYMHSTVQQNPEQLLTRTSQSSTSSVKSNLLSPRHMLAKQKSKLLAKQVLHSSEHLTLVWQKFNSRVSQTREQLPTHQKKAQKLQPMAKRKFFALSDTKDQVKSKSMSIQSSAFLYVSLVLDPSMSEYIPDTSHYSSTEQTFISLSLAAQQLSRLMLRHLVHTDGLFNDINNLGILN